MAKWKVIISEKAQKEFLNLKSNGAITIDDQNVIRAWVNDIVFNGVDNIIDSKKWNDHALDGEWAGYRSSSFSFKGRIIYKVDGQKITVIVVRITDSHNYKKGVKDG